MDFQQTQESPKVLKETKNSIRVEFERTDAWTKFKLKYFSVNFLVTVIWAIFRFVLLLGISYVILQPFFAKIASSFMSREDFVDVTVKLIPRYPTLDTYRAIIEDNHYFEAFFNTLTISLSSAIIQTFICSLIGYGFAKFKFKGSKLLFLLVVVTMLIPHKTLQLSMFMKFKHFDIFGIFNLLGGGVFERFRLIKFTSLDFCNSYWPLFLLSVFGLAFRNGLYIFMMRQFYRGVPDELEESAYIDGSGVMRTFFGIIIPLSIPMMMTIFLFSFSWQWTDNFYTNVFYTASGPKLMPDVVGIPRSLDTAYAGQNLYEAAIRNTCGLMILIPLIVVYCFGQKALIQGIERSGITG